MRKKNAAMDRGQDRIKRLDQVLKIWIRSNNGKMTLFTSNIRNVVRAEVDLAPPLALRSAKTGRLIAKLTRNVKEEKYNRLVLDGVSVSGTDYTVVIHPPDAEGRCGYITMRRGPVTEKWLAVYA